MKGTILKIIPVALLGLGMGLGFSGAIPIPFLTKKKADAAKMYAEGKDGKPTAETSGDAEADAAELAAQEEAAAAAVAEPTPGPEPIKEEELPEPDPEKGNKMVAKLWNEMDSATLVKVIQDWRDEDIAKVFLRMDAEKVSELLGMLEAPRASKLTREIQRQASLPKPANS